ncbi:cobalamin binding intrinsic factor [Microcaecilia unicolor]|uniref:Cobalamin binding intrinsic factor-like n=1 Tax=Microcaecilia unicolor TaxID=1415580 RepID=A0A6P7X119_9AMPH|nr:cobalamin binding intrinsic factor-like [Microcaecilia unicolor]
MLSFTFCVLFALVVNVWGLDAPAANAQDITVEYTVINDLQGNKFKFSMLVTVPEGSVLLDVMKKAEQMKPEEFSFTTEETSWGPFVTSIHHLSGSSNDKTYWRFLSGTTPLEQGVGTYKPRNNENILAIFSTY